MFERFKLGNPDLGPAIILSDTEHKAITAALNAQKKSIRTAQDLWAVYQDVYRDYPRWLEAIKPYFKTP
jgi:hypothetical protein